MAGEGGYGVCVCDGVCYHLKHFNPTCHESIHTDPHTDVRCYYLSRPNWQSLDWRRTLLCHCPPSLWMDQHNFSQIYTLPRGWITFLMWQLFTKDINIDILRILACQLVKNNAAPNLHLYQESLGKYVYFPINLKIWIQGWTAQHWLPHIPPSGLT